MNEEIENETEETEGKSNLIGVDPLAWLSDEEKSSLLNKLKDSDDNEVTSEAEMPEENSVEENSENFESTEEVNKEGNTFLIKLESSITIREITELLDQLNNIDSSENSLIFDCSQIEKTDAAAMQLLTGYYLFAKEEGKNIVWDNPSEAFCNAVSILGLNDIINIPSVAA